MSLVVATRPTELAARIKRCRRGRPSKLVALMRETGLYAKMLGVIRAGAFGWVAAEAIGIAPETFSRWLARGRERRGIYRQFRQDVQQAAAQARVVAEIEVYRTDPKSWLRLGPGRTTPGCPGWTDVPRYSDSLPPPNESLPLKSVTEATDLKATLEVFEQLGWISILPSGIAALEATKVSNKCTQSQE